jgi:DNA-binding NarL/FixJ family response regulator
MVRRDPMAEGRAALARGEWEAAKAAFAEAVAEDPTPDALDGLGRAQWWTREVRAAIRTRTQAVAGYRREGRLDDGARSAVWVAREHRVLLDSDAAADGWLARAETFADGGADAGIRGWIALARAEATTDVNEAVEQTRAALDAARSQDDPDLEVVSLARLGLLHVASARVDEGIAALDEAMAAATAGEARDPESVAQAYCALLEAAELLGDSRRFEQWTSVVAEAREHHGLGPLETYGQVAGFGSLSAFCGACCGGMYLVSGRVDDAEAELVAAIAELEADGMESRCVHPATQLAELRVLQGRLEEARELLSRYEDLPESVRPLAVLELADGAAEPAAARLERRIDELGRRTVVALPLLTVLVDAHLRRDDLEAAAEASDRIATVAELTESRRHRAEALVAAGKVAAAGSRDDAVALLREATRAFSEASLPLQACRARMVLARALLDRDRPVAVAEARAALAAFDRLGATPDADAAAAFLRSLGVKGRTGPKDLERLSKREVEVLRLVAEGLSNAEIAARLFISTKTAGHHVSNILTKLGLRSRTEAAAFAVIHLGRERVPG